MAVKIGHASISEKGTVNGTKGDQTKKEVCVRNWYSKPWDFMAVHPDATVRENHAAAVEAGCANDNIGYGQGDRNTLNTEAKKVNYDLSKVGKCNTDCSEFMNVCAVASGAPGVTHASNGWTTSTMRAKLKAAGYIIITDASYLKSEDYCVRGAIYVSEGHHTVCGLSNGSKYKETLEKAGITTDGNGNKSVDEIAKEVIAGKWGSGTERKNALAAAGYDYATVQKKVNELLEKSSASSSASSAAATASSKKPTYKVGSTYTLQVELKVRKEAGTGSATKKHSQLTADGQKHDKDNDGALDAGTVVTCKEVKNVGNDIWIRTPSGWVAAYYKGEVFVK